MKMMQINGKERMVFHSLDEYEKWNGHKKGNELIARPCVSCGDQLLGSPASIWDIPYPKCVPGYCRARQGVSYV